MMRSQTFAFVAGVFALLAALSAAAQPAPPAFPQPAPFDPKTSPLSAEQQAAMIRIPGGTYRIGAPADHALADRSATPAHEVTIRPFRIDKTEVTNGQFVEFLNSLPIETKGREVGGNIGPKHIPPEHHRLFLSYSSGPAPYTLIDLDDDDVRIGIADGRFVSDPGQELYPVQETSWAGAAAYCAWRGARLPTEAEWEAAARGREGRIFPWGDAMPTTELAVMGGTEALLPAGSRPLGATPDGVLDMAGSLAEWTSTLDRPYPYRADDGREDPALAGDRVVRGGAYVFENRPERLTTWNRTVGSRAPSVGHRHIGFRCAAGE